MADVVGLGRRVSLTVACLLGCFGVAPAVLIADEPATQAEYTPLSATVLSDVSNDVRRLMLAGDYRRVFELLRDHPSERITPIYETALTLADADIVDPLANIAYNHDFIETAGAFVPNGKPNPVEYFSERFRMLAEADPEMKPVIADAICNVVVLQLLKAVAADHAIALSDDILFSKAKTSAERVLFQSLVREVMCSDPKAREAHHPLHRAMFLQKLADAEGVMFFYGGPWIALRRVAAELDPASIDRWWPEFATVAVECGKKGRFTSGALVAVHGCRGGVEGAMKYLLEMSADHLHDARSVTNLKIAFGYVGETARSGGILFPPADSETFDKLKSLVESTGDPKDSTIALEVSLGER